MTTQPFTARVASTVTADGMDFDYTAIVRGEERQWAEHHPYGMGTAREMVCEREADSVEIIEPLDPEDWLGERIKADAKEKAEAL